MSQLRISEGEDAEPIEKGVDDLTSFGWKTDSDEMGVEAAFSFPTFAKASDFITLVNIQCKMQNHHPETYNVRLRATKKKGGGLGSSADRLPELQDGLDPLDYP